MTNSAIVLQDTEAHKKKLLDDGYCLIPGDQFQMPPSEKFKAYWDNLPPDEYLKHDYIFRYRRYGQAAFVPVDGTLQPMEAKPYEQSTAINSYAGGIARVFPPLLKDFYDNAMTVTAVNHSFAMFSVEPEYANRKWVVDFHLFHTTAKLNEVGLPTPEGIHQDGFPFGSIHFIQRHNVTGGVTSIYDLDNQRISTFEMSNYFDSAYLFDQRVKHSVSPLITDTEGYRDVFVIGFHLPNSKYDKPQP
jgi:hypothetical protein